jgi:hypothetical protein
MPAADQITEQIAAERAADATDRGVRQMLPAGIRIGDAPRPAWQPQ